MKKILLFLGMFVQVMLAYSAPDWSVSSSEFEYSLTITGIVEYNGVVCSEGDMLAAFVNGECRGVAHAVYEESMDKYYFYLTVFSNTFSGEQVSFKYFNLSQDNTIDDFDGLEFEEGLNIGSVSQPYVIAEAGSMNLTYTLTFVVTDGTTAIEAAEVSIDGATVATDASGNAVFADMASASYDYTVTAAGYDNTTGSVTIIDADIVETVSMDLTVYSITLTVNDGTTAIEGAYVTIDGTIVATNASGKAEFTNMVPANYNYTVATAGYNNATGSVSLVDADIAETVSMTAISTGINDVIESTISVYPNPVKDFVNIDIEEDIESISIYNSHGQIIYMKNTNEKSIDLSELRTGIYFISVFSGVDIYQARILKN